VRRILKEPLSLRLSKFKLIAHGGKKRMDEANPRIHQKGGKLVEGCGTNSTRGVAHKRGGGGKFAGKRSSTKKEGVWKILPVKPSEGACHVVSRLLTSFVGGKKKDVFNE